MDYTSSFLMESMAKCAEQSRTAESNARTLKMEAGEFRAQVFAMIMGGAALYQQPPPQAVCLSPQVPPINVPHQDRKIYAQEQYLIAAAMVATGIGQSVNI